MRVRITSVNPDANNNTLYAEYEKVGDEWVMRQWRIEFDHPSGVQRYIGEWNKIHGNQKRPIGHMPIKTRTLHLYAKGKYRKMELVGK